MTELKNTDYKIDYKLKDTHDALIKTCLGQCIK